MLKEPKAYLKAQVAQKLQQMLFALPQLRLSLRLSCKQAHESFAQSMSKAKLSKSVCRIAVQQLLERIWKKRRVTAGAFQNFRPALGRKIIDTISKFVATSELSTAAMSAMSSFMPSSSLYDLKT